MSDLADQLSKLTGRPIPKKSKLKTETSKSRFKKNQSSKPKTDSEILTLIYRLIKRIHNKDFDLDGFLKLASGLSKGIKLNLKPGEEKLIKSIPEKILKQFNDNYKIKDFQLLGLERLISKTAKEELISSIAKIQKKLREAEALEEKRLEELKRKDKLAEDTKLSKYLLACSSFFAEFKTEFVPSYIVPSGNESDERYLNEEDIELILTWNNGDYSYEASCIDHIYEEIEYEGVANKLISARYAEKIAMLFYKEIGQEAKDLSIQQLQEKEEDWQIADLKVCNKFVDVKNARKFRKSGSNYSEQFIKRFKQTSKEEDVIYLGTLSKHMGKQSLIKEQIGECTVLGEVTNDEIEELRAWVARAFGGIFNIELRRTRESRGRFSSDIGSHLPGWLFEYPNEFYNLNKNLTDSKKAKISFLAEILNTDLKVKQSPFFYVFADTDSIYLPEKLKKYKEIIHALKLTKDSVGITRRSVFVTVLGTVLQSFVDKTDLRPRDFLDVLFYKKDYSKPLGLLDTEEYIHNLVKLLDQIWFHNRETMLQYSSFRLSGFDILRGFSKDEHWETIYAYCGGKEINRPTNYCRKNPIHLNNSDTCPECRMLICPDCKTCFNQCGEFLRRKR